MMLNASRTVMRAARPAVAARLFSASAKVRVIMVLTFEYRVVGQIGLGGFDRSIDTST